MENELTFLVVIDKNEECEISNNELTERLCHTKNKIGNVHRSEWNKDRKHCNPFEDIVLISNLTNRKPISRAYYKITEICKDFNIADGGTPIGIMCLAEAPGAFVQYFLDKRTGIGDTIVCNTLNRTNSDIPEFDRSILGNRSVHTYMGADNSGDICKYELIMDLVNKGNKFDVITGDGGIDTSLDYNSQDTQCRQLILCEIIIGIGCLNKDGDMIIKIFDIDNEIRKALCVLCDCFQYVYLTKPKSSRPANSEKYIVCKKFLGYKDILNLIKNVCNYNSVLINIEEKFENQITNIRGEFVTSQIDNINKTINKAVVGKKNIEWEAKYKFIH